jgi:hypothetical protein
MLNNEKVEKMPHTYTADIHSIGYEHFELTNEVLEENRLYYGRVDMPVHPKHDVVMFFEKVSGENLAKITKMHPNDVHEWSSYLMTTERMLIREMKGF